MLTAATMFSIAFPRLRWFWLTAAIAICSTRVIVLDHFLSDAVFGACIGYVGSLIALKWMKENTANSLY
jgi:membrane-associated phospholipid phosphatase